MAKGHTGEPTDPKPAASAAPVVAPRAPIAPGEIVLDFGPADITGRLSVDPRRFESQHVRSFWHLVEPLNAMMVTIQNTGAQVHSIRLSVSGQGIGWNPAWVRWSFARRRLPVDYSGQAIAAQDFLAAADSELVLLLLPNEKRRVTLELRAFLDDGSVEGDFRFTVNAVAADGGERIAHQTGTLRLRHPEPPSLTYLPAIYHSREATLADDPFGNTRRMFLERFLQGFEDAVEPTRVILNDVVRFFDVDAAPSDFIPWLATWVGVLLDENWPELRRRLLIKEAVRLYRWRGTRRGLCRYLELYTGGDIKVHDHPYTGMHLAKSSLLGRNTVLGGVPRHAFIITVAVPDPHTVNEEIVRGIVESEKPAPAAYELRVVEGPAPQFSSWMIPE